MFSNLEPLPGDGYAAMVTAHKTLLARLVDVMAERIQVAPRR